MKTIGQYLKQMRLSSGFSLEDLEAETKIKRDFLNSIETGRWGSLPEYPVVLGFVKNISRALKADKNMAVALLRRDYPPTSLPINPKPDVAKAFTWGPKHTFFVGVALVLVMILSYLSFQYIRFMSPPKLEVLTPYQQQAVEKKELQVSGFTDPEATLKVNNQPILVAQDGSFQTMIEITDKTQEVIFKAQARSGKETTVVRSIYPQFSN